MVVNPLTSENMMVISRSSPPSTSFSADGATCPITPAARSSPNASLTWPRAAPRSGLDVVGFHRRGSGQDQLALDLFGRNAAVEDVRRRGIERGIAEREMNPKLAIEVGRNLETLETDALDPGLVGFHQD